MTTFRLYLSGEVQAVGMRFFINRTSKQFGLKGQVRNLSDGRVECIVQGELTVINQFIQYIKRNSPGVIGLIEKEELNQYKEFKSFSIKLF